MDRPPARSTRTDTPFTYTTLFRSEKGVMAAAVRTLEEIVADPPIVGGGAITLAEGAAGYKWPLFNPPYKFSSFEPLPLTPIGTLGEANAQFLEGAEHLRSETGRVGKGWGRTCRSRGWP